MATRTLRRRLRTIPSFWLGLVLMLAGAPVLLPLLVLADAARWLVRRRHWMGVRLYLFGLVYLGAEVIGLVALGGSWLAAGLGRRRVPLLDWTFAIQQAWAGTLLTAARAIFGIRIEVTGQDAVGPGPILLLVRHASIVDNQTQDPILAPAEQVVTAR